MPRRLTHIDGSGRARMVDVGAKAVTRREALAEGAVGLSPAVVRLLRAKRSPKGNILAVSRLAGILAAKRVDELIPLCHTVPLDGVEVSFILEKSRLVIRASARAEGKTGVEMEALTAVSVAALTVYDMCKAVDKGMTIGPIRLLAKSGGRSGDYAWR
jgi:cyclic pyranopterin phosphate synthase